MNNTCVWSFICVLFAENIVKIFEILVKGSQPSCDNTVICCINENLQCYEQTWSANYKEYPAVSFSRAMGKKWPDTGHFDRRWNMLSQVDFGNSYACLTNSSMKLGRWETQYKLYNLLSIETMITSVKSDAIIVYSRYCRNRMCHQRKRHAKAVQTACAVQNNKSVCDKPQRIEQLWCYIIGENELKACCCGSIPTVLHTEEIGEIGTWTHQ